MLLLLVGHNIPIITLPRLHVDRFLPSKSLKKLLERSSEIKKRQEKSLKSWTERTCYRGWCQVSILSPRESLSAWSPRNRLDSTLIHDRSIATYRENRKETNILGKYNSVQTFMPKPGQINDDGWGTAKNVSKYSSLKYGMYGTEKVHCIVKLNLNYLSRRIKECLNYKFKKLFKTSNTQNAIIHCQQWSRYLGPGCRTFFTKSFPFYMAAFKGFLSCVCNPFGIFL